jgi:catechol 2,3-dioxygenase-like lactoylglutathione lyase family enzyme
MEQRVSLITLAVADLDRARAFYEALGWRPATEEGLGIVAFDLHGAALALYPRADFARDIGTPLAETGVSPVALAYNVREKHQVAEVLAEAERAGGRILKPAEDTFWGGRSGYFADPEGHLWEVAWNPHAPLGPGGEFQWNGAVGGP